MNDFAESIWREYDIRGLAGRDINDRLADRLGRAVGTIIRRKGGSSIAVGRDCRLTSDALAEVLMEGLRSTGCSVCDLGMVPTPLMYFAVVKESLDGGIVVTASHNPAQYNGFKIRELSRSWFGADIQYLRKVVETGDFERAVGADFHYDVVDTYVRHVINSISLKRPLRVVVDAGNGSTGPTAVRLLNSLGCDVIPLFCEPNGTFPNHLPDPTVPEYMVSLRSTVQSRCADLGLAFDGDGDRVAAMTGKGDLLWGDRMLTLFARDVLSRKQGPVVFDVKCSLSLVREIKKAGGEPVMWKTGYPLIQAKMKEVGAQLAGEMSGHMYFADRFFGFDDGLYAACRILELLSASEQTLDQTVSSLPQFPSTPEMRLHCSDDEKFNVLDVVSPKLAEYETVTVDGVRFTIDAGWGLIRVSNTEPAIVTRFEAESEAKLAKVISVALDALKDTSVDVQPLSEFLSGLQQRKID